MTSKISQIIDEKEDFHPYPLRFDFVGKLNLYEMVVMRQHHGLYEVAFQYHSAVSPLNNTNWIHVILQLSEVIDLI